MLRICEGRLSATRVLAWSGENSQAIPPLPAVGRQRLRSGMKSNANLLIAILLMISFMLFWDSVVVKRYAPPQRSLPKTATGVETPAGSAKNIPTAHEKIPVAAGESTSQLKVPGTEILIQSRGARVTSWKIQEKDHWLELVRNGTSNHFPLETFSELNFAVLKKSPSQITFAADHPAGYRITKT